MGMAPVSLNLVTDLLVRAGAAGMAGILQVSADRDITYEAAALHLAARLGVARERVQAVPSCDMTEPLPRHTTLDTPRLRQELGLEAPPATAALDSLIAPT